MEDDLQRKVEEYQARERTYFAGLVGQEAELNALRRMSADVRGAFGDVSRATVRSALVDPAANMEVMLLRQKVRAKDQVILQLKEEAEANRFDQRLPAGQALMRKCKVLLNENHELGEEMREERLEKLRTVVKEEQRQNAVLLQKCQEAAEFCKELSQENDKLQGTISKVAGRLREARAELEGLKQACKEAHERAQRKKERQRKAQPQEDANVWPVATQTVQPLEPLQPAQQETAAVTCVFTPKPPAEPVVVKLNEGIDLANQDPREKAKDEKEKSHKPKDKTRDRERRRRPEATPGQAPEEPGRDRDRIEKDRDRDRKRKAEKEADEAHVRAARPKASAAH